MKSINQQEFRAKVSEGLALVDFSTTWCEPCGLIKTILMDLDPAFPDYIFYELDCDENKELIKELRILSVPTLLLYREGELLKEINGLQSRESLERVLVLYGEKATST